MSEEKLDVIIKQLGELKTSVGGINTRIDGLDARMGGLETKVSGLETQVSGLDARMGGLEKELSDFKKQVLKSLQNLQTRLNTLEKQLFAIGFELKEDIKREVKDVRDDILGLENKVILQKADRIKDQVVVREIDLRVLKLELLAA
jgi:predicted  nucleic acid-binding Zn-ribbon protein